MRTPSQVYEAVRAPYAGAGITRLSTRIRPLDWTIQHHQAAGLPQPCLVRFKLFTLDERLILKTLGNLAPPDCDGVAAHLSQLVG